MIPNIFSTPHTQSVHWFMNQYRVTSYDAKPTISDFNTAMSRYEIVTDVEVNIALRQTGFNQLVEDSKKLAEIRDMMHMYPEVQAVIEKHTTMYVLSGHGRFNNAGI
jgi:hypothetical protein